MFEVDSKGHLKQSKTSYFTAKLFLGVDSGHVLERNIVVFLKPILILPFELNVIFVTNCVRVNTHTQAHSDDVLQSFAMNFRKFSSVTIYS